MELLLFDEVGEALRGLIPPDLGDLRLRAHRYGIKVWFGPAKPPREHYEAQVIGARHVPGAEVLALEIGFHAENPQMVANDEIIAQLLRSEKKWRRVLGKEAVVGGFIGRPEDWRRISETWPDPDLGDPELGFEIALRLIDYLTALEPARKP